MLMCKSFFTCSVPWFSSAVSNCKERWSVQGRGFIKQKERQTLRLSVLKWAVSNSACSEDMPADSPGVLWVECQCARVRNLRGACAVEGSADSSRRVYPTCLRVEQRVYHTDLLVLLSSMVKTNRLAVLVMSINLDFIYAGR